MSDTRSDLLALQAILVLKMALRRGSREGILHAYDMLSDNTHFSWDNVSPYLFDKWDKLTDKANDFLFS